MQIENKTATTAGAPETGAPAGACGPVCVQGGNGRAFAPKEAAGPQAMQSPEPVLNLASIVEDSIVDGPGIRVTIFCQGCPHGCPGCHNPQSHPFGTGTDMTVAEVYAAVRRSPLCRGITFSGGEPFCQPEGFTALARLLRGAGYEIACYTGYTLEQLLKGTAAQRALLEELDVLVDGPFVLAQRNLDLRFRGSENQRILDVPRSLANGAAVWYDGARWTGDRA